MKNRLPDKNYINRLNSNQLTEEESKYKQLVQQASKSKYLGITQLGKLTKIAEHLNISIEVVLDEIINAAYDLLPNTVKQPSTSKIKRLTIPITVITLKELITYLSTKYNKHNELVFNLHSYNSIADSMINLKMYPSNLKEYLKYHYPEVNVTIKD